MDHKKQDEKDLKTIDPFQIFDDSAHDDAFVKYIFDHIRNIALTCVVFAAASWEKQHIGDGWIAIWDIILAVVLFLGGWALLVLNNENLRYRLAKNSSSKWTYIVVWLIYIIIFGGLFKYLTLGK